MTPIRKALAFSTVLALCTASVLPAWAEAKDPILESSVRILSKAINDTRDTSLSEQSDSSEVIAMLRSSHDKDLLPFFEKLRQSNLVENQIYAMVSAAILVKDPKQIDLKILFASHDQNLVGSALASLAAADLLSVDQMRQIAAESTDPAHRVLMLGELNRRKQLTDHAALRSLLTSDKQVVRYYAAVTLLSEKNPAENAEALGVLDKMGNEHDLRQAVVQALILVQVQKENIQLAAPWAQQLAQDEQNDEGLRYTALSALLSLKSPEGPAVLEGMIQKQHDMLEQVKLGLISLEFASQLKASALDPLTNSKSTLARTIAGLAQQAANGENIDTGLIHLLQEGHPIVLDWALAYSDRTSPERKLAIRSAIVNQSTIVDDIRGSDFERASLAAQKILDDNTPEARNVIATTLKSENRAVVEATLAGIYRSTAPNQSELVLPIWPVVSKSSLYETSANYAALILAREGRKEVLTWLPGMVMGGTVQSAGFRGLAGWYYAQLLGKGQSVLKQAIASAVPPAVSPTHAAPATP